jgi:hypothetical protein
MDAKNSGISGSYKVTINPPFAVNNQQSQAYKMATGSNFNQHGQNNGSSNKMNNNTNIHNNNNIVVGYNNKLDTISSSQDN